MWKSIVTLRSDQDIDCVNALSSNCLTCNKNKFSIVCHRNRFIGLSLTKDNEGNLIKWLIIEVVQILSNIQLYTKFHKQFSVLPKKDHSNIWQDYQKEEL